MAATALSTFGIMPWSITPAFLAPQRIDVFDNGRVDFARQSVLDNVHRRFVSGALALDEMWFQAGGFHRAGDCFAATMDDDRVDAHRFEEHEVASDAIAHF